MNLAKRYSHRIITGDFSQGQAFWAILLPGLLTIKASAALLSLMNVIQNPVVSTRIWLPIALITFLIIVPLLFASCYRSIYIAKQKFKGGPQSNWLFGLTTLLAYLTISTMADNMPYFKNMADIAFLKDNKTLEITIDNDTNTLKLEGQLTYGSTQMVAKWLGQHASIQTVELNIDNGHLHEARTLAQLIIREKLDTRVEQKCAASCMLVLVAGHQRTAVPGARMQFHRTLDYDNGYRNEWIIERERNTDRAYYSRRAVKEAYIFPIYYPQLNDGYLEPGIEVLYSNGVINRIEGDAISSS